MDTFIFYLYTEFDMPRSNGSLVVNIKMNANYRFCAAAMLFSFYEELLGRSCIFF